MILYNVTAANSIQPFAANYVRIVVQPSTLKKKKIKKTKLKNFFQCHDTVEGFKKLCAYSTQCFNLIKVMQFYCYKHVVSFK